VVGVNSHISIRMTDKRYAAYILANASRLLYVGFTSQLENRIWKHKNKMLDCSTKYWAVCRLVYFEQFDDPNKAISREKQIKRWTRAKKIALIEAENQNWKDLSEQWGIALRTQTTLPKAISVQERQARIKAKMKAAKASGS
jgi:putative endonuclease